MASNKVFQKVSGLSPGRSTFDLSYDKIMTADMGFLIPVMIKDCVPGDRFKLATHVMGRMNPTVKPILHEINIYQHSFFVAYRNLWPDWEKFWTGGEDGLDESVMPTWTPADNSVGSLWDYLENPPGVNVLDKKPVLFQLQAYNDIYNEYYRNLNFIEPVPLTDETLKKRCWERDYFTSSLPFQQRGTPAALPLVGTSSAQWADTDFVPVAPTAGDAIGVRSDAIDERLQHPGNANATQNIKEFFNGNTVDLSNNTFNIADLRLAFQIQKWQERNARAGGRYIEQLNAHYGPRTGPLDARLDRPEFIGGNKTPLIINPIRQTNASSSDVFTLDTPQGNLAGEGVAVDNGFIGSYLVREHGIIMTILSIMPRSAYQQGIDRQWLKETRYDYYSPEFANLSEQGVFNAEIFVDGTQDPVTGDSALWGYQGHWDELRTSKNQVAGKMRSVDPQSLDYWHLARDFGSTRPLLNQSFVECTPDKDRIFAVPTEPGFVLHVNNRIVASRPLPYASNPGLIDHH